MAAAGVYGLKTLNDNWLEDRLQPAGALSATGCLDRKSPRAYETDIAYIGERYDVLNRISRMPTRPSYANPDDGFNEKIPTSRADYAHPRSRIDFVAKPLQKPAFITQETVPEVNFSERRPVPGNPRGFGAVVNRHEEGHEKRYWNTTQGEFFGEGYRKFTPRLDPSTLKPSGVTTEMEENRIEGVKVGKLTGEAFSQSTDPAADTATQRSWLYCADPSLRHIDRGGTRPDVPRLNNELSLPTGDGAMSKVRADLKERKGFLYRTATHITKGLGQRPGVSVFQDAVQL